MSLLLLSLPSPSPPSLLSFPPLFSGGKGCRITQSQRDTAGMSQHSCMASVAGEVSECAVVRFIQWMHHEQTRQVPGCPLPYHPCTPSPMASDLLLFAELPVQPVAEPVTGVLAVLGSPDRDPVVFKPMHLGAGELFQRSRTKTALAEGLSLIPSTHIRHFTIMCNSPRGSDTLF